MKRIGLLILLVGLIASSASASTTAAQSGNWNDPNTWSSYPSLPPVDEDVKLSGGDDITVTVNDDRGSYQKKLAIARGNILSMTAGALTFDDDIKVGDGGASSSGTDIGYLNISGGTLTAGDRIAIGYYSSGGGEGYMTVSGTAVVDVTGGGGVKVGCENGDGAYGYLKIVGDDVSFTSADRFHVANDSTSGEGDLGHGVVEFELNEDGYVSRIVCEYATFDSQDSEDAIAELIITATGTVNAVDIVLWESTSTSSTVGEFDTLSNGTVTVSGEEGAEIQLGTEWFRLTYAYDCDDLDTDDNDIALVWIPEPATMALLALGGLIVRRKK